MVAMDAQGHMFIYDRGNDAIRMVTLAGNMVTLIGGACRQDHTMPTLDVPFDLTLRGMVCYKKWVRGSKQEDLNKVGYRVEVDKDGDGDLGNSEDKNDEDGE